MSLTLAIPLVALGGAAAFAYPWIVAALADRCTCAKGRWDPECPRHGRST